MIAVLLSLLLLGGGSPAEAGQQEPPAPASSAAVIPPRVGVESAAERPITLDEAIRMTLEHNNDVSMARLDTASARQDIRAAEGAFDPRLVPALSYQRATTVTVSAVGGGTNGQLHTNQLAGTMELSGRSPWLGGRFSTTFSSSRLETSNLLSRLNPQFPSAFGASYVQPLFRGRTIDVERRQILLSRRAADLTDSQLTQVVMDQLTLVEGAYWDLVFAQRNLQVQATALTQAQTQVESNERQVREGTLAPIDVVEAQIQVANFRQSVASAQQTLTQAENRLKALMLANRQADMWNEPLQPTEPADRTVPALPLEEAMRLALERRPELQALETARAQIDIDRRYYGDLARPQVNLVGSYALSGLAGGTVTSVTNPIGGNAAADAAVRARLNELSALAGLDALSPPPTSTGSAVPGFLVGSYSASLSNLFNARYPTALVQLQVDLPIANNTAKANIARTQIAAERLGRQRQQLEQAIEAEVRNALQAVRSSHDRLDAASSARRNAQEQYESERRRFDSGLSTVFLVLERQTALVTAQAQELRSQADLNQAAALLDRATGGTLVRHQVQVAPRD
jgi:HAE1 family hydrophobic/amphiphilic exporter-1